MQDKQFTHWRESYFSPLSLDVTDTKKIGQIVQNIYASYMILVDSLELDEEQTKAILTNINSDVRLEEAKRKMDMLIKDYMKNYGLFSIGKMNIDFIVLKTNSKDYIVKGEQELRLIVKFLNSEIELGDTNFDDFIYRTQEHKRKGYQDFEPFTFTKTNIQMPDKTSLSEMELLIGRYEEADTGLIKVIKDIEHIFLF